MKIWVDFDTLNLSLSGEQPPTPLTYAGAGVWRLNAVSPKDTVWLLTVLHCSSNINQFLAKLLSVFNIF